jgi:hypothetical protein
MSLLKESANSSTYVMGLATQKRYFVFTCKSFFFLQLAVKEARIAYVSCRNHYRDTREIKQNTRHPVKLRVNHQPMKMNKI